MTSRIEKRSPAKINLILKVLKKRSDGYHDIFSVMQAVSLYDVISIDVSRGNGVAVKCSDPGVPSDSTNLAHRAAMEFLKICGIDRHIEIAIDKKIPVGAGLGGGSSNAATVLLALNDVLRAGLSQDALLAVAARLGSDVPFFMLGTSAEARGRGEILKPLRLPRYQYILVNPGVKVSTAWVYGNFDLTKKSGDNNLLYSEAALGDIEKIKDCLHNDLELVTLPEYPELVDIKKALVGSGALGALMSGSGPTVFGVYKDAASADAAIVSLTALFNKKYFVARAEGL